MKCLLAYILQNKQTPPAFLNRYRIFFFLCRNDALFHFSIKTSDEEINTLLLFFFHNHVLLHYTTDSGVVFDSAEMFGYANRRVTRVYVLCAVPHRTRKYVKNDSLFSDVTTIVNICLNVARPRDILC